MLLTLCLTHDCNLRCSYCYAGRKFRHHMNHAIAEQAIIMGISECLRLSKTRNDKVLTLGFFGGEPLLQWPLLQHASQFARERSESEGITLNLTLTTNASLMDSRRVDWLCQQSVHVGLSLDGNPDMHNTLRKFKNGRASHAHCSRALKWFKDIPNASYEVIIVLDPRNVRHLSESIRWLLAEGVRSISINPNFFADWSKASLKQWRNQYEKVAELYESGYRSGEFLEINIIDTKIRTGIKGHYSACSLCGFGEDELAIAPSGNIYPCERVVADDTNAELCIGHVLKGFDAPKRTSILASRGNANIDCVNCDYRQRCMNWCCCINYATTGLINSVDGLVCFHEQLSIDIADRVAATLYDEANPLFLSTFYADK